MNVAGLEEVLKLAVPTEKANEPAPGSVPSTGSEIATKEVELPLIK